ncbi:hypothetical protein [Mycolicibacterium diernhoferi]|uniref:Uncharacterized protein n=1 Tax=Mycolicibacterium diernhoferi TaxID=1801 RepID=A0A1Q4HLP1_9MYCO|nr:hypothetical protein [Mycolicibacterium diernhoferi]OJZ68454.1 hypothetical protein BRW64_02445 [Mycolicibacterium diernhoferi]OPE55555.1 hypothetical protein BV510_04505 [Mycolicibacterium diernhoferi]PEG52085.1 hypothetical protein CRI78_23385 [Mycolicibacterium diernhoferi]QYL21047.1 hypothetical protein K0O62_18600 [Mycolicibacterium diernhoferi]
MKDLYGRTPAQVEDDRKHALAEGTLSAWRIDQFVRDLQRGGRIDQQELDSVLDDLEICVQRLKLVTIWSVETSGGSEAEAKKAFSFYSDGTPVVELAGDLGWPADFDAEDFEPADENAYVVPWLPSYAYPVGAMGPKPPNCTVVINEPAHDWFDMDEGEDDNG